MEASGEKPQFAWQPLTMAGVAAFARASANRLFIVQLTIALLTAGTAVWFVQQAWFPTIREAIGNLPPEGEIRSGILEWRGDSSQRLAEGRFLAFSVDLKHEGETRSPAHLQVEFGRDNFEIYSLFGVVRGAYPRQWSMAFNRPEVEPWWGAWDLPILVMVAGAVLCGLLLSWAVLATMYTVPVWLVAFFASRSLGLGASWRLAGAALMPGALLLIVAIVCYGLGVLDLLRLVVAWIAHLLLSWVYLLVSPLSLPRLPEAAAQRPNPFLADTRAAAHPTSEDRQVENKP